MLKPQGSFDPENSSLMYVYCNRISFCHMLKSNTVKKPCINYINICDIEVIIGLFLLYSWIFHKIKNRCCKRFHTLLYYTCIKVSELRNQSIYLMLDHLIYLMWPFFVLWRYEVCEFRYLKIKK